MKNQLLHLALFALILVTAWAGCSKKSGSTTPPPPPPQLRTTTTLLDNAVYAANTFVSRTPSLRINYNAPLNKATAQAAIKLYDAGGQQVNANISFQNGDSSVIIQPQAALPGLTRHTVIVLRTLSSVAGSTLASDATYTFFTGIDESPKFPSISNDSLLSLIQKQTLKYFVEFAHPVSKMARERNTSNNTVTTGGTGFGVMALVVGVERGFITRAQAVDQLDVLTNFLLNTAARVKGAFPHWMDGTTGAIIPFSANDNGADLVETSFLCMGLVTAQQYFTGAGTKEVAIRNRIETILNEVDYQFFRKNNENVLYWHYSPDKQWAINLKIQGWNECMVTYVLAASYTNPIPAVVYNEGFARNGAMKNDKSFYNITLPLGPDFGGPLFFSHYSFLGINPNGLKDQYADYWQQNVAHTRINYNYCVANPKGWYGYGPKCWGLTASDIPSGYTASSPTNDVGVIAPTAAVSALPYTPTESMEAIRYFYYTLGDKLFKEYGFIDAFKLQDAWFASSFLAIDQGPQVVMIENHRSGLLWRLFTSAPRIKEGMKRLGFTAPYLN